jgi:hypothetical protein
MKYRFLGCASIFATLMAMGRLQAQVVSPQQDQLHRVIATGCLKQEKDVAPLTPNVVEHGGPLGEDFILTRAVLQSVTTPSDAYEARFAVSMYRITGQSDEKLRAMLNQQVEVIGRLESAPRMPETTPPVAAEPDKHAQTEQEAQQPLLRAENLPQIHVRAITAIAGNCAGGTS